MSSKNKKGKKKAKTVSDVTKSKDTPINKKVLTYFTNEELTEIKAILKIKDATGIPLIIGATVLYKFDILKKLIKDGYNVNQTTQNNTTALMWAVKYRYMDMVDYLITNGADPTIKTDSGDNVLIQALEHKLLDEHSIINLWKKVKKVSFIDVNFTNKNGHNMLHMCVRRDWEQVLKILLTEKPDVDAANFNGVTPLMLACFRNNIKIIEILIKAGADILKEDNHGRMPLCYAISSCMKIGNPSFLATEKIIIELKKKSSFEKYLKRRVELIIATAKKSEISCATAEMLIKIVKFSVQFMKEGILIFLECDVFTQLLDIIASRLDNSTTVKFLLEVCEEILFYNEQCVGYKVELGNKLVEGFFESGFMDIIIPILRNQNEEAKIAFNILVLANNNTLEWENILKDHSDLVLPLLSDCQNKEENENRAKILKNKKRKLKKLYESLDFVTQPCAECSERNSDEKRKTDNVSHSKKSKRRSKAIKAKLAKMKTAELTKRLKLNQKPTKSALSTKTDSSDEIEFLFKYDEVPEGENPIVDSFQHLLEKDITPYFETKVEEEIRPKWKKQILSKSIFQPCKYFDIDEKKLESAINYLRESASSKKFDCNFNRSLNIIIDYFKQAVQMINRKYREHWENDKATGRCSCSDIKEHVPWLYNRHIKNTEARERQLLQDLQKNFDQLMRSVKELSRRNLNQCLLTLNKVESMILKYEIRGIKVLSYISGMENFTLKYTTANPKVDSKFVLNHVQNVVNNKEEPRKDIEIEIVDEIDEIFYAETYKSETPMELYYREMAQLSKPSPRNKRLETEAKLNTMANSFHLINSIMSICDDSDDETMEKSYGVSDLNYPPRSKQTKSRQYHEISEYMPKRLKSQIDSLQKAQNFQDLLGGNIRIAVKEQRVNYIISAGINFSAVELGLDLNNKPLAVKRIQRESWVGKIIKTLVDPLLGLVHNHILHYFACEYEGNELILATPLCKWTMAQYVQLLRESSTTAMPGLTTIEIVKQFLEGLMVLHKREIPIVHGNLKPSNIFIDFNGLVKIAEFGIHKALYKIIEAPKSSLVWFAKETIDIYKNSSIVECSLKSDIQVAGMLTYFILSCGKHPFGEETEEILKNIQKGVPKLTVRNLDMKDLLLWMMLNDANERPDIEQVLAHPAFWSTSKKWSFVLSCSGINQTGYMIPINFDKLYRSIETFSERYITVEWHEMFESRFPNVNLVESDNLIGLLKCIKHCYDHPVEVKATHSELSSTTLSLFPALPVALYRTLQNTNWFKHPVFSPFCQVF